MRSLSQQSHKAFTLIEMLLVIVIIGILSVLLFRTLADMTRISGRIQFEKMIAKNLVTIHTTTNYLAEHYPHVDMKSYKDMIITNGYTNELHLISRDYKDTASLTMSGADLFLQESKDHGEKTILSEHKIHLTGVLFRILPTEYNTGIINLPPETMSAEGFWMFGTLYMTGNSQSSNNIQLNLQHFVHLKQ